MNNSGQIVFVYLRILRVPWWSSRLNSNEATLKDLGEIDEHYTM